MLLGVIALLLLQAAPLPSQPTVAASGATPSATLVFDTQSATFGDGWQFGAAHATYVLRNTGTARARVLGVEPAQPGGDIQLDPGPELLPGASLVVRVRQDLGARLGRAAFRYSVRTDQPGAALRKLTLSGFVQSAYDPERALLDLGALDQTLGGERALVLATREASHLRVVGIEGAPAWLHVDAQPEASDPARPGLRLRARVAAGAPLGLQAGVLRVRTDLARQPTYELAWRAAIFGDVVPAQPGLDLGLLRLGESRQATLALRSRTQAAVRLTRVEVDGPGLHVEAVACDHEPGCVELRLGVEPRELGTLAGRVLVHLVGASEPLPIPYAGLVVRPDTQVRDLPLPPDEPEPPTPTPPVASTPTRGAAEAAAPVASERRVTLRWRAARESGVHGFLVYRAERREGPYLRLNAATITVPEDGAAEHVYEYFDDDVHAGHAYFYYLDSVSTSGVKQTFSGVLTRRIAAEARPPAATPGPR